jgi:hypothetical protein
VVVDVGLGNLDKLGVGVLNVDELRVSDLTMPETTRPSTRAKTVGS